jgi:general secretion pathway protein J
VTRRAAAGFTLIEVLLAIVLLGLLSLGVYGAISTSTRAVRSGELAIERTNKLRVTQELLRRQLSQALAVAYDRDPGDGRITNFAGERDRLTWVSAMPGYLGRGGPYVQQLAFERDGGSGTLRFRHALLNGFELREGFPDEPGPVVLLERVSEVRIGYRGITPEGRLDDWQDDWDKSGPLPLLVRIEVEFERGSGLRWPPLVVPVMVDPGAAGAALEPSFFNPVPQPQAPPDPQAPADPQAPPAGGGG